MLLESYIISISICAHLSLLLQTLLFRNVDALTHRSLTLQQILVNPMWSVDEGSLRETKLLSIASMRTTLSPSLYVLISHSFYELSLFITPMVWHTDHELYNKFWWTQCEVSMRGVSKRKKWLSIASMWTWSTSWSPWWAKWCWAKSPTLPFCISLVWTLPKGVWAWLA